MITMYDSIFVDQLPVGAGAYAGYVDGFWPTYSSLVKAYPRTPILSIAVNTTGDADCLDVEAGDAPIQAIKDGLWYERQIKRGVTRPCFYMSASLLSEAQSYLQSLPRNSYRLWSAHYTTEHVCGPKICGYGLYDVDGTQWTPNALGRNLDQSILNDNFFSTSPTPPIIPTWQTTMMNKLPTITEGHVDGNTAGPWFVHRIQGILNSVYGFKLTVDGNFGPATAAAVKAIEKNYKLTVDKGNAVVGPQVWSVLYTGAA